MSNQNKRIIDYLTRHNGITQMEAMLNLGICRLSERIRELEADGYKITRVREECVNVYGNKSRYVRYWVSE